MKRKNCFVILGTFTLVISMNLSGCGNQGDVKVTVTYTDSTKFILRIVVNGGVNPEASSDAPAAAGFIISFIPPDTYSPYS